MIRVVTSGCIAGAFMVSQLPWAARMPVVAVGVWVVTVLAWIATEDAIDLTARGPVKGAVNLVPKLPMSFGLQFALSVCVPPLGSVIVLFGNLAVISSAIRSSPSFPSARVVR